MEESVSAWLARRVRSSGRRYWTAAQLREGADSYAGVKAAVHRLVKSGILQRVRRGLYWHNGKWDDRRTVKRRARTAASSARALLSNDVFGAAGRQAVNLLGLSTQVSPIEMIAMSRRPPRAVKGVRFIDRSARRGRVEQQLSELEVTVLEALESWEKYVELPPQIALERVVALLKSRGARTTSLAKAAVTEPAVVRERLRAILELGGWADAARIVPRAVDNRTRQRSLSIFESNVR